MFDGSYEIFERIERPSLAEVVAIVDGKIAIGFQRQPTHRFTSVFGGRMEKGEKPLDAAKRELLEESGLVAKRWKLLRKYRFGGKVHYSSYLYAAIGCKKIAEQNLDAGEMIRVGHVTFGRFLKMVRNMRVMTDTKLYFMEIGYEPKKRKKLEKELGIK